MRKALVALAFLAATVTSLPTFAAQLQVSMPASGGVRFTNFGTDASYVNMQSFSAALLGVTNPDEPSSAQLLAYAIEPDYALFQYGISRASPAYWISEESDRRVQRLFEAFFLDSLNSVAKQAGFQLALWEIVYDGDSGLRDGRLAFRPGQRRDRDARSALLWANYYLRNFDSEGIETTPLVLQWWRSETSQDLITASVFVADPVPLPAPLVLLGSALAVLLRFRARGRLA